MSAPGLNVVGYLDAVLGQGQSARRFCSGLDAAGVPWAGFGLRLPVPAARRPTVPRFGTAPFPHRITVLWCNPDRYGIDIPVDPPLLRGRYTIGRWAWELGEVPVEWREQARALDEVWVISEFVAQALRPALDVPVHVIPLPLSPAPRPRALDRGSYGVADGAFLFCFAFDHHSTLARKNPGGVITAYRRAFGPDEGTALLIKSVNASSCPQDAQALHEAAAGRDDIVIVDAALAEHEQDALLAGCDCYVSLHRSEGFGMSMAEALAHGTPVIATGYGGNLDYMASDELLVGHALRFVGPDAGPYPADGVWAEPDLDHAAALMRRVASDPPAAARHGERAAARLAVRHALPAAARVAAEHVARAANALNAREAALQLQQPSDGSSRSSSGPSSSSSASE
ncbi:MAG: glycosyltransferase family 4 protein [Solirubrobacteraceae bacterium]